MAYTKTRRTYGFLLVLLILGSACGSLVASSGSATSSAAANEPGGGGLSEQVVVDQLSESDLYGNNNGNKRAWQSLQSSWGKRASAGDSGDPDIYMTGHFVPLVITDGTNTIDWDTFERLASGQTPQQQQLQMQQSPQSGEDLEELAGEPDVEKRAWKSMNVAWGKRRQAQGWNKFRGAWGKREPTWNNLKGMWGKRDQWQKLHGGWGKRSAQPLN